MRASWAILCGLWLALLPRARAEDYAALAPRILIPGQEARAACASCGLILPTSLAAPPQTGLITGADLKVPTSDAPQPGLITTLSSQFGPVQPGQSQPSPEARLGNLFDLTASAKAPALRLEPIATGQDGTLVSPQLITPESLSREHALGVARLALSHSVRQAQPALAESVRRGQWNGPDTRLDKPCCGDAAPKLGLLLHTLGYSVHAVEMTRRNSCPNKNSHITGWTTLNASTHGCLTRACNFLPVR